MWCITIERGGQDMGQLFYKSKELAKQRMKQLLMDKLNSLMYYGEKDIDISEIVSIETIESLIRSFLKRTAEHEDNDDDEYYEANKLEVTLSKVVFEDAPEEEEE